MRSFKLGYFTGGFQAFIDRLSAAVTERGGDIKLNAPVAQARRENGQWVLASGQWETKYDKILHTTSPEILAKIVPELPPAYLNGIRQLDSMAAVVMTIALDRSLLEDGTYWLNLPAVSVEKSENPAPFLALVEHTNYIDKAHYGDDVIVYAGDYVTADHPYMSMSKEELEAVFIPALKQFNVGFEPSWIRKTWVHKATYAQPVPAVNHSVNVPQLQTPLDGLYWASMSHVYPWDRGTNFAVEIGRKAAQLIRSD